MTSKKQHYENLSDTIIEKLNLRGIDGYCCEDSKEALNMASRFLTPGCSISWGGSETIKEIGLLSSLRSSDYILYDRDCASSEEEKSKIYSKTVTADYYFMSSNAITLDGELVNIDGSGNRVACLIYGPKNVIIIAGMNKVVPDVKTGVARVQNSATPPNAIRLSQQTPCRELGRCVNCLTDDCLCCNIVVTRKSRIPGRIKVILVGEELGY